MRQSGIVFVLGLVAGSIALQAQTPMIPFDKIQRDTQAQLKEGSYLFASTTSEGSSSNSAASSAIVVAPRTAPGEPRAMDGNYFLLNGLHLSMAILDIGLTQRCIAEHECKEGNPLMPATLTGQAGVTVGLFAYSVGASYYLKKHGSRAWWIPPISGIVTHSFGVASGLAH